MTALNSLHDRFFKAVFGRTEVAAEFLGRYLPPAVAGVLDWATLRAEKDSFLDPELAHTVNSFIRTRLADLRLSTESMC